MKHDVGSNFTVAEELVADTYTGATSNGAGVDHANGPSVAFFISAGAVGTTLDMKAQYSDTAAFTVATDYPASDPAGNDDAIAQLAAPGTGQLNIPNPRGRYSRVVATSVGACEFAVVSVLGPLRHIAA